MHYIILHHTTPHNIILHYTKVDYTMLHYTIYSTIHDITACPHYATLCYTYNATLLLACYCVQFITI